MAMPAYYNHMYKRFAFTLLVVAAIVAAICLIHPATGAAQGSRLRLALSIAMCLIQLTASWYFLASLKDFKPGLRAAYILITVGTFMIAVPALLFSVTLVFTIPDWVGAVSALFYFSAALIVYLGVRRFAKLLSIHYLWTSLWFGIGLAFVAAAAISFVPGAPAGVAQLIAWSISFSLAATIVAVRVRSLIGDSYTAAMNALVGALALMSFTGLHETMVNVLWPNGLGWYTEYGIALWPYVLMMVLLLQASLLFYYGAQNLDNLEANGTFIDAVTYAASLVSTPAAIDSALDKLRVITSNLKSDMALTAEEKMVLVRLYLEIERYLTTKEPLRQVTRQQLRSHLTYDFQQALKSTEA